jgi:glycosyltransferase involved in cell wall biosynthesis
VRVLFLTDSLSDLDGVGRYAVRLITAMEALRPDLEVRVGLARKHRPTSADVPERWRVEVALPPDYFFYMSPLRFWGSLAWSLGRLRGLTDGVDLVHAIKDYPHSFAALLAARRAGVPCVATAHGTYSVQPLLSARHARLARWTYARFASMISVSAYTKRRLLEVLDGAPPPAERVRVVPNAVDADHYADPRDVGPRPWHGVPFTLSIGELKERKGHHLVLEAWARVGAEFPDWHHFVVGNTAGDAYELALRARAAEAGLGDRVHFLGNVTEDEKVDLLQRAGAFLHTPVHAADGGFEGFGIVYLEAGASGTACVGTTECGAEDAIVDGRTGLLVPADADAVEGALRRLLGDAELRASLGAAGREHARSSAAGWERNARAVLDLYDEALR